MPSTLKKLKIYIPALILLLLIVIARLKTNIPINVFLSDPAVIAGSNGLSSLIQATTNPFVGVASNIGILCWCISASVCFFSCFLIRKKLMPYSNGYKELFNFLLLSGLITSVLLIDDLFLLHEAIIPKLLKIPQYLTYSLYMVTVFYWINRFRKIIIKTEWDLLALAFIFFTFSIFTDTAMDYFELSNHMNILSNNELLVLLEDGFKLFGIISWLTYLSKTSLLIIETIIEGERL
ncbi:hypothetical protein [Acaryochloris marina]|uniref:Uncharacterized protein n=1 Tax=Acaryochloris marina (strain MBIC 11017) TaxID=329726 RepID=B0CG70_ACAM1|nr:hypothetical protein [Acaryochloris marina]ABW30623.1 conserved hypothetical protein [Acaryochloris marina MBIC11017]